MTTGSSSASPRHKRRVRVETCTGCVCVFVCTAVMTRTAFVLLAVLVLDACCKNQLAEKGVSIMLQAAAAARTGQGVRQCSCAEMQRCIASDEATMAACSRQCYGAFSSITATPYSLQPCLDQSTAHQVTSCVTSSLFTCGNGAYASRYNYNRFYSTVLLQVQSRKYELSGSSSLRMIQPVANAGLDFGICAISCFVRSNPDRCFDSLGCQPQVNEQMIRPAAKRCFKQIEGLAASKCYCALNAGVSALRNFCGLASTLSRRLG